jgi:hypothetical protein
LDDVPENASEAIKTIVRDWIDAYAQIVPLLESTLDIATGLVTGALDVMRSTKALADQVLDQEIGWQAYRGLSFRFGAQVRSRMDWISSAIRSSLLM